MDTLSADPIIDKGVEFESICSSVTAHSVYAAELLDGTKINGVSILNPSEGFGDYGDGELTRNKSTWADSCEDAKIFSKALQESGQQSLVLSVWDEIIPDKSDKIIFAIGGYQKQSQSGSRRGNTPYYLYIEMPRSSASGLVDLIIQKPDYVESFYQRIYGGLDALPNQEAGLRRIKTDSVKIINIKDDKPLNDAIELKLSSKIGVRD